MRPNPDKSSNFAVDCFRKEKNYRMVYQCGIIFGFLAIGELIVWLTGIKLPSSIIGMLLLTACLQLKWIRLRWVEGIANFLVKNLGFFFIPPGVALMLHLNVIKAQLLPIIVASAVSTVVVIVVTGWIHQLVRKYQHRQFTKRHGIH
jgi:holin-like protein